MKGKNSYLDRLEKEESSLGARQQELRKKRRFYESCQIFFGEATDAVLKHVVPMISKIEGVEYVDHVFSMEEEDHYETFWVSPYEGQYGVSGAELAATAEPRQRLVEGKAFRTRIIVDKATCDTFSLFSFQKCDDYSSNLAKLLATKKFVTVKEYGIQTEDFSDMFPYVSTYLGRLIEWRLENDTKEIPEEVLRDIALKVTDETVSTASVGSVKQAKK